MAERFKQRKGALPTDKRPLLATLLFLIFILIIKHPVFWPLGVIILAAFDRPQKDEPRGNPGENSQKHKEEYRPHAVLIPFRRHLITAAPSFILPVLALSQGSLGFARRM